MVSIFGFLNRLLPFATPGTPLIQDLLHLGVICAALYFAPQIQEWVNRSGTAAPGSGQVDRPHAHESEVTGELNGEAAVPQGEPEANGFLHDGEEDNDDDVDDEAEMAEGPDHQHHRQGDNDFLNDAQPGPAHDMDIPNERNVGAKKAKSLAKKDQRRAYNEFMRSQGEAQRAKDAEGAAEREAVLAAEKQRRLAAEAALETKKAKEREQKREAERREREEEFRRRDTAVSLVRDALEERQMCDLFKVAEQVGGDVDDEWVERVLNASGLLGTKGNVLTMITSTGWAIRVSGTDVNRLYGQAVHSELGDSDGFVSFEKLAEALQSQLEQQGKANPG